MTLYATPVVRPDGLRSGEENCDRLLLRSNNNAPATGVLRLSYFTAKKTEDITQIRVYTGGTAAAATPTLARIGVWTEDPTTGDLTLVAATANDTTLFAATATAYSKAFSAGFIKRAGTRYAFASLVVSGAAVPSFVSVTPEGVPELALAPRRTGQVTGQTDLPSTIANASILSSGMFIYGVLLP